MTIKDAQISTKQSDAEGTEFSFRQLFIPLTHAGALHILILLGLLVFANSIFNGFVGDDFGQLVDNPAVHFLRNIPHFFFGGTFNNGSGANIGIYYKPLMMSAFTLLYALSGGNAWLFHLFQIILHICNSILVYFLFCYFFKKPLSLFLSLLFLVHPLNSEVVFYVSDLQDALFFFFGMSSVLSLMRATKQQHVIGVIVLVVCSLLSKTTGVVFMPMLLLLSYWYKRELIKPLGVSLLVILVSYSVIHYSLVGTGFSNNQPFPIMRVSFLQRLLNIPSIVTFYLGRFFYPKDLAIGYQGVITQVTFSNFLLPLLEIGVFYLGIVVLFTLLIGKRYSVSKLVSACRQARSVIENANHKTQHDTSIVIDKRISGLFLFVLWLLVGLGMHIQLIPLDFTVAERWFYFPMVGLLGIFGVGITLLVQYLSLRAKRSNLHFNLDCRVVRASILAMTILIISVLATRTFIRSFDWRNGLTLAAHDTQIVSDSYSLYAYYGVELFNAGKLDQAITQFKHSTDLAPYWFLNWNYLGQAQERKGSLTNNKRLLMKAKISYETSLKNGTYEAASVNYTHLLLYHRSNEEAQIALKQALQKFPYSSELWYNQALLDLMSKNQVDAKLSAQKAYQYDPSNVDAAKLLIQLQQNAPITIEKGMGI